MATGRLPDPNTAPLTAKGDLYTYSTVPARLAVGSNGDTLVADSSATTGLRWGNNYGFTAGKNKIINGDFGIWQRGTSFSNPADSTYTADRWVHRNSGTSVTRTISQQTFTPGTAPVAGYEGQYFYRYNISNAGSGNVYNFIDQPIEDVRVFAGQTVTLSFWAKADATRTVSAEFYQNFGSGGSAEVYVTAQNVSVTTSWQRFSLTFSIPSISGKTIGTSSSVRVRFGLPAGTTFTVDLWGVQAEIGSVATAFQTATGTLAGELAACQRYYYRTNPGSNAYGRIGWARASSTTNLELPVPLPVAMRVPPTAVDYASLTTPTANTVSAAALNQPTTTTGMVDLTSFSLTSGTFYLIIGNNSTSAYIGFSAEL